MNTNDPLYLKTNVQVEPLFDQWYAWPHLISPATAARNVTERHMKIMDSYIAAPDVHASAVKNPKFIGGPFMDYAENRRSEIERLREWTKQKRGHLFELSAALAKLESLIETEAKGFALDKLYGSVPDALRGYVELVYDLNNKPSFRLIEGLLYRSRFYDRSAQSLMLSEITGDDRPFVLSTPRLASDNSPWLKISFENEVVDALFNLKVTPQPWEMIDDMLGDAAEGRQQLKSFFSPRPPRGYMPYRQGGVRWRYFGHACILIETGSVSILSDPVLSYTYESKISRYTYEDIPHHIDFVIITHNHQDHVLFETLLQLRHKVSSIIVPKNSGGSLQDPSMRLILENTGFKNIVELGEMDSVAFENGCITGLPFLGEHADLDIRSKLAYLVRIGQNKLLFAADSRNIEPKVYEHVHDEIGDIDALFLGMECDGAPLTWLYGPLLTRSIDRRIDMSRRLAGSDYEQAIDIVKRFCCKELYVYAMGQEPWLNHIMSIKYTEQSRPIMESNRLIADCKQRGIVAERLFGEKEILLT